MPNKITTEEVITRFFVKHGSFYGYSKVFYVNAETKVCIICPLHGEFYQTFHNHLNHGCPSCWEERRGVKITTEAFIKKAVKIHGLGTYDYSRVNYDYWNKKVCIVCKKHGEIWQRASFHLRGYGCYKCSRESKRCSLDVFISKANAKHGMGTYDYSKVELKKGLQDIISIICQKHGVFQQRAQQHLEHGCPQCKCGKGEKAIRNWLVSNKVEFESQYTYPDLKGPGNGLLKFDFYIPLINLLIEYDGEQHFGLFRFCTVEKAVQKFRKIYHNDNLKDLYCSQHKIPLLRIPFKNYKNIPEIMRCFFGGPLSNLGKLISMEEYGFNLEDRIK